MPRIFVAIDIPHDLQERIHRFSIENVISVIAGIKGVGKGNYHITIRFVGEVDRNALERISDVIGEAVGGLEPFAVRVRRLGAFPSPQNPRTIWVGAESDQLFVLKERVERGMTDIGYKREFRFVPHVTLGRVKGVPDIRKVSELLASEVDFGEFLADRVKIFESTLTPSGPIYTVLNEFLLR